MGHSRLILSALLALACTAPALAQPRLRDCTPDEIRAARAGTYAGARCRFTVEAAEAAEPVRTDYRPQDAYLPPQRVHLSEDFFTGGLAGGVERPVQPLYSYRGLILIDARGRAWTGSAGLEHRVRTARAMDAAPRRVVMPAPARPARAYPYD